MVRFNKSILKNGIRVVSEQRSNSRAVSIGIWVTVGTRDEFESVAGVSHLLEHMVFKGTKNRSCFEIAKSLECLGGELNAYTTREYTCYHALVLREHWQKALDVLCDIVSNMDVSQDDFRVEKSVIQQEIAMIDDSLEELVYDEFFLRMLPGHPLGKPILGTAESIDKMKLSSVKKYYKEQYTGSQLIVALAGGVEHEEFLRAADQILKRKKAIAKNKLAAQKRTKPKPKRFRDVVEKQTEQLHLLLGIPCSSFKDRHRFEAFIVNTMLGGGMTSKLYQSIREKKGLVYSVYSSLNTFVDFGLLNIYASCEADKMKAVAETISREIRRVLKTGISAKELEMYKTQVIGSIVLGSDDIENRMQSIAVNEMVFESYKTVDEVIAEIQNVTVQSVNKYLQETVRLSEISGLLLGGGAQEQSEWFCKFKF